MSCLADFLPTSSLCMYHYLPVLIWNFAWVILPQCATFFDTESHAVLWLKAGK
jgi:hypothetical protein